MYELTPTNGTWTKTILDNFSGPDGSQPVSGVVFDSAGNLYGTTEYGGVRFGSGGYGVVFKLTHSGGIWTESVLCAFTGQPPDGEYNPPAEVIFDQAGNIYGTTAFGGLYRWGTVFQLSRSGSRWAANTIYSVQQSIPLAGLTFDQGGNLYGAMCENGLEWCGGVFEVRPSGSGWTDQILYDFTCYFGHGGGPADSLLMDTNGNLFGTTIENANYACAGYGCGTVFQLVHNPDDTWSSTSIRRSKAP